MAKAIATVERRIQTCTNSWWQTDADPAPKNMEEALLAIRDIVASGNGAPGSVDLAASHKDLITLPDTVDGDTKERAATAKGRIAKG
jgi:hypothetical protein